MRSLLRAGEADPSANIARVRWRGTVGLVVAFVVVLGGMPAASARSPLHRLVITGSRNTVIDVRLPALLLRYDCIDVQTKGRLAGLYFEPRSPSRRPEDGSGALVAPFARVPDYPQGPALGLARGDYFGRDEGTFHDEGCDHYAWSFGWRQPLAAGTYRVHLLTDAPVTIRLPARGLRHDVRLRPTRPGADMMRTAASAGPTEGGTIVANLSIEAEARDKTVYFAQSFVIGRPATLESAMAQRICIREVELAPKCPRPLDDRPAFQGGGYGDPRARTGVGPAQVPIEDGQTYNFVWAGYRPDEFGRASVEAVTDAVSLGAEQYATLALVGIGLAR